MLAGNTVISSRENTQVFFLVLIHYKDHLAGVLDMTNLRLKGDLVM